MSKKKKKKQKNRRLYLERVGIRPDGIAIPMTVNKDDNGRRYKRFLKERAMYGFDSRETWALEYTASVWLYEHLCMYLDQAEKIVNLETYKFKVPTLQYNNKKLCWNDNYKHWYKVEKKKLTQKECIELCITYLDNYLFSAKVRDCEIEMSNERSLAIEQMGVEKQRCAFEIFAKILPAMWW